MLICRYTDRLEIEYGVLTRIVTGNPINKKYADETYDFYKETVDNKYYCRNLYTSMYNGYRVAFPGHELNSYYGYAVATEESWGELDHRIECFPGHSLLEHEKNMILKLYPDFKYVLKKWSGSSSREVMTVIKIWLVHPEIEYLLAAGYTNIAFNKSFWKYSEKKRKEICLWLRKNPVKNYCLNEVIQRLKYKLNDEEWNSYILWNNSHYGSPVGYELYKYLRKQEDKEKVKLQTNSQYLKYIKETYSDYKKSFKSEYCIHNFNDPYWKYPKDLYEAHRRLNDEINAALELARAEEEKNKQKAKKNTFNKLRKVIKEYEPYNCEIDGYSIFMSGKISEWQYQAKQLHQCIVASNYYTGVANGKYFIVFIQQNNKPIATAQVYPDFKIGQFYGDEIDRSNCLPSEEVKKAFKKYLDKLVFLKKESIKDSKRRKYV